MLLHQRGLAASSMLLALLLVAGCSAWAAPELAAARRALEAAPIPAEDKASISARIEAEPKPFLELLKKIEAERAADPMLLYAVDKSKALPKGYAPKDLVSLDGKGLSVSREGLRLREAAYRALKAMDKAARAAGVALLVSSSYRSYEYQVGVWDRGIAAEGEEETARSIAKPGHSQHQLGTAIDFGSITDEFAQTKASRWLEAKARGFGFTLSFPKGMDAVTGYKWESWHYRYVGAAAASLEKDYFGSVQEYLMLFLDKLE